MVSLGNSTSMGFLDKPDSVSTSTPRGSLCALCKGSKKLCGKDRCPLMVKFYSLSRTKRIYDALDLF